MESTVEPFEYDGGVVDPGESEKLRFAISETYLGDPVRIPVTIVNGAEPGPTCFLSAAIHGDELNGIEVVREVVDEWDHDDIHGCVVGLPVLNVPGFITQERYLPIYERDLNRAFPGKEASTSAYRIAHRIYTNFIAPCDFGIDFHTSTRGRTNMFHVRADMENEAVARLAHAFGSHVIIASEGSEGTLRREATEDGVPTITIEMGEAHRFEPPLIEEDSTACGVFSPSTGSTRRSRFAGPDGERRSRAGASGRGSGQIQAESSTCITTGANSSTRTKRFARSPARSRRM